MTRPHSPPSSANLPSRLSAAYSWNPAPFVVRCRLCDRPLSRVTKDGAHYQCRHRVKLRAKWAEQAPLGRFIGHALWAALGGGK
jgi:hypothetical protein